MNCTTDKLQQLLRDWERICRDLALSDRTDAAYLEAAALTRELRQELQRRRASQQ